VLPPMLPVAPRTTTFWRDVRGDEAFCMDPIVREVVC